MSRILLLAGLGLAGSGCSWIGIVTQSEFKKEKEQTQTRLEGVRKELLAHTQILANHGKAIYEVRLQMRDALSGKPAESTARAMPEEKPAEKPAPARREMEPPRESGRTMYIRSAYQGFALNYAAGYRAPRGQRFPYRLAPGTEVRVLSRDDRGFTQVEVRSGPNKGRRMWVRTRWLVGERPARGRG